VPPSLLQNQARLLKALLANLPVVAVIGTDEIIAAKDIAASEAAL
jgi:hypothetical protein